MVELSKSGGKYNFAFLKSIIRKTYNREVNEWFHDDDPIDFNISTSRKAIRSACLVRQNDTQAAIQLKMRFFRDMVLKSWDKPEIFGIPVYHYQSFQKYAPYVTIYLKEDLANAKLNKRRPLRSEVSIRYRGSFNTSNDIELLRTKINQIFATPRFSFDKGREKYFYQDPELGHQLVVNALNGIEAKSVFNKLLAIQDDGVVNDDYFKKSVIEGKNWNEVKTKTIAGNVTKLPKMRPIGKVWYYKATFSVYGSKGNLILQNLFPYSGSV